MELYERAMQLFEGQEEDDEMYPLQEIIDVLRDVGNDMYSALAKLASNRGKEDKKGGQHEE